MMEKVKYFNIFTSISCFKRQFDFIFVNFYAKMQKKHEDK